MATQQQQSNKNFWPFGYSTKRILTVLVTGGGSGFAEILRRRKINI